MCVRARVSESGVRVWRGVFERALLCMRVTCVCESVCGGVRMCVCVGTGAGKCVCVCVWRCAHVYVCADRGAGKCVCVWCMCAEVCVYVCV